MPILGYFNNMWYGSASAAMVVDAPVIEVTASAKMDKRLGASIQGGQIESYLKMTRALKQTLVVDAGGEIIEALPKMRLTVGCSVSIGATPSAFDIAQAVWGLQASMVNNTGTTGQKLNSASASVINYETLAGAVWSDPNANVINEGIKKASLLIPHSEDLS